MTVVYVLAAILMFGFLIAIHEFGHFLAAKLCGVRVNEFSIGMGPLLWQHAGKETDYSLRLLPIGGYCAMAGEDDDSDDEHSLNRQSFWKKFLILAAGAFLNFVTGVVILLVLSVGVQTVYTDQIAGLAPEFVQTGENGLMEGDLIYKVNGYRTYLAGDTGMFLQYTKDTAEIEVVRDGRHILVQGLSRQTYTDTKGNPYTGFGITVTPHGRPATLLVKLQYVWDTTLDFVQLIWFSLAQLFSGGATIDDVSGPVGIVSTITQMGTNSVTVRDAWLQIFYFAALIAVNLAVMNLLPIPALDGGRIFFLIIDAVCLFLFRRKVPERYQAAINVAGLVVLMGFMLLVTCHDVYRLFQ